MSSKLTGRITVHGDKPADTAVVEIHNSQGDVVDQVQVDADGRYTYHLSAGNWSLNVWDNHGHRGRTTVELTEGSDQKVDLDLDEPEEGH
ncbi:MAG: hypothetical protein QOK47_799 [Actinomycetota bacterium]|jgi:hypothetical protein|nr:hypothetical protein [Actinomycetota bacterium]